MATKTIIMGISAATLAETDLANADHYVLADVTYDADGQYVSHDAEGVEYPTYAEAWLSWWRGCAAELH